MPPFVAARPLSIAVVTPDPSSGPSRVAGPRSGDDHPDRHRSAREALAIGEELLGLYLDPPPSQGASAASHPHAEQAREYFAFAVEVLGGAVSARSRASRAPEALREAARAHAGLGRALFAMAEPAAREELEDAGTLFEELGDVEGVAAMDALLRECAAWIEESPRSFQSGYGRSRASTAPPEPPR